MRIAALLVALVTIVVGVVGIVSPDSGMTLRRLYFETPSRFYTAGAVRVAMGLVLILAASRSRWPWTLRAFGAAMCLQALVATVLGIERAQAILEWEGMQGNTLLRAGAVVALATGGLRRACGCKGPSQEQRRVAH